MAKPKKELACHPNWARINELVEQSDWSRLQICTIVGKSPKWFGEAVKNDSKTEITVVQTLAALFKVDVDELLVKEASKTEEKNTSNNSELQHAQRLETIETKLDKLTDLITNFVGTKTEHVDDGKYTFLEIAKFPKPDRAKRILKELIAEGNGKCLYTAFTKALVALDLGSSYADNAIKDCLFQRAQTGYGSTTITWILDPYWEGENNGQK